MTQPLARRLLAACGAGAVILAACGGSGEATAPDEPPAPVVVGDPARRAEYAAAAERARQWLVAQGGAIPAYMPLVLD